MIIEHFPIVPCPAPRWGPEKFTKRSDKFKQFRDDVRKCRVRLPERFYHVVFILPIPKSWALYRKRQHCYVDHFQTPDKDNLEKALMDSMIGDDKRFARGYASKMWGPFGALVIATQPLYTDEGDREVQMMMEGLMFQHYGREALVSQFNGRR